MLKAGSFFNNEKIMLGVLFIAVFSFFLSGIFVPGLQSDEACDGLWAYYIINPHIPLKEIEEPTYFVTLFNRFFPVMANHPYIGAVESYLLVPFFLLFGVSVFSLRLMPVVISLVTVFLVYRLCKDWFGKKMAVMALLLTVTNLAFVMFSRVGLYREELFSIFFFWSGIFYFQKYITKQKIFYFCLGCFLFGLGISAKIIFLWYIIGTIFACAILGKIIFTHFKLGLRNLLFGLAALLMGSFLLIFYNISKGFLTVKLIFNALFSSIFAEAVSFSYLEKLITRIGQFFGILRGNIGESDLWVKPGFSVPADSFSTSIFILGFIFVPLFLFFKKGKYSPFMAKKVLFLYLVFLAIFFCTPFTLSKVDPGHLFIMLPFPQIVIALFLSNLLYLFNGKKIILFFIYTVFLSCVFINAGMVNQYNVAMKKNGGAGSWSTAIYELAGYLSKERITPLALEWGFQDNISFLTKNKIRPKNFNNLSTEQLSSAIKDRLSGNEPFYLITTTDSEITTDNERMRFEVIKTVLRGANKSLMLSRTFFNRAGRPVYFLYKVY